MPQRDSLLLLKQDACLITLTPGDAGLSGTWGKVQASLKQVGSMNNVKQEAISGKMEVPLWVADSQYMYIGTWGIQGGRLMLRTLDAIGIASGKRERTATLECIESGTACPGLLYTEVYLAGRTDRTPGVVTVGYSNAEHEDIVLQPVR